MDTLHFAEVVPGIKSRPLSRDRMCACGRSFRGEVERCTHCRKSDRTRERVCACGITFVGNRTMCSDCKNADSREYYKNNTASVNSKHRDKKLGLQPGWYAQRLVELDGKCAACGQLPPDSRSLSVDHDHSCCDKPGSVRDPLCGGCVRDLLCINCNSILGMAGDSIDRLMSLAAYLMRFQDLLQVEASED